MLTCSLKCTKWAARRFEVAAAFRRAPSLHPACARARMSVRVRVCAVGAGRMRRGASASPHLLQGLRRDAHALKKRRVGASCARGVCACASIWACRPWPWSARAPCPQGVCRCSRSHTTSGAAEVAHKSPHCPPGCVAEAAVARAEAEAARARCELEARKEAEAAQKRAEEAAEAAMARAEM